VAIRPASWDDLVPVVGFVALRGRRLSGVAAARADFLQAEWERAAFTVGADNWVAEDGGALTGYAALTPRGDIVLAAATADLEDELLCIAVARGRANGHATVRLTVTPDEPDLGALVRRHPFTRETETLRMWRTLRGPLPAAEWPDDVTCRTYGPSDALSVHALLDEAYGAWDRQYVPLAHDDWVQWMTGDPEYNPTVWLLAECDGALAGCALHWSSGWLKDIAVAADERRRGIGTALLATGLAEFARRGVSRVGLKVDADNPTGATRLYESFGFMTDRREAIWALSL